MNTREAIEKVRNKYEGWQGYARTQKEVDQLGKERDEVIDLLKHGKKYEQMWEEMNILYGDKSQPKLVMNIIQRKAEYFPKNEVISE